MPDRFFCSPMPLGDVAVLEGPEAHHLSRVLRKTVGELIEIFDGRGQFALAEIESISKKAVELRLRERGSSPPPLGEVILASAVPKGDRFRWLVEKAVELGVDRLVPLITERSVVKPGEGKRDKMEQAVVEASKQCRRNHLMELDEPMGFDQCLKENLAPDALAIVAHPDEANLRDVFSAAFPSRLVLMVGPEGGFTDHEVDAAKTAGAIAVGLGVNILRIETAALALAAFAAVQRANS
jgi:16S rRNA (uracil1498-N3)-methyltransferase